VIKDVFGVRRKWSIMNDEEKRMVEFNNYIDGLIKFMNGENDDFEPIPIPKEVDDEMQKDSFY
jgi:hypothetical protein